MKKYHFPFIDLDKEEEWINKYIRQGWRLRSIFGLRYEFVSKETGSAPHIGEVRPDENAFLVRCDVRSFSQYPEYQNYLMMFEDAGWRHVSGNMNGDLQYFERIRPDASGQLFSDIVSRAERYLRMTKRYLTTLLIYFSGMLAFFMTNDFRVQNLFNMKDMYFTPGLWDRSGLSFWASFLFETPFALLRGGVLHLLMILVFALELYAVGKSYWLYKRR
ncbi:MAG TPA: DUF2812 domain-containing protein [Candidatus Mediterraneibacter pullistercoris]|nr:DUF2812 domain-containing protein [Candidatus Mediterraneibacter pullistercoris]